MYIKELKPNMLVIPQQGYTWQLGPDDSEEGILGKQGIAGHILMHYKEFHIPGYAKLAPTPAVYMYSRVDKWLYGGVYKHHYLLIGDQLCIVDGYQFGSIEPLKNNDEKCES